jgi:hypothetical protein
MDNHKEGMGREMEMEEVVIGRGDGKGVEEEEIPRGGW